MNRRFKKNSHDYAYAFCFICFLYFRKCVNFKQNEEGQAIRSLESSQNKNDAQQYEKYLYEKNEDDACDERDDHQNQFTWKVNKSWSESLKESSGNTLSKYLVWFIY